MQTLVIRSATSEQELVYEGTAYRVRMFRIHKNESEGEAKSAMLTALLLVVVE